MVWNVIQPHFRNIPGHLVVAGIVRLIGGLGVAVPFTGEDAFSAERLKTPAQPPIPAKRSMNRNAGLAGCGGRVSLPFSSRTATTALRGDASPRSQRYKVLIENPTKRESSSIEIPACSRSRENSDCPRCCIVSPRGIFLAGCQDSFRITRTKQEISPARCVRRVERRGNEPSPRLAVTVIRPSRG